MLRSEYTTAFCTRCLQNIDHVKLTYIDHVVLTCMFCQEDTVVKETEKDVLKSYRIVTIHERNFNTEFRRMVIVEIERTIEPDKLGETETIIENFMVQYPAYGKDHFTASVEFCPDGKSINFIEANAISAEIKSCVGEYK